MPAAFKAAGIFFRLSFQLYLGFMKKFLLALSAAVLLLSGCSIQTINTLPSNPDCICTMEYDPVCVKVNGIRYRYSNPCAARCDGYTEADYFRCPE